MATAISADGTLIAYDRRGQGPSLVVVCGALAGRAAVAPLATLLAPDFTVLAYARRGLGASGDTPPYAVEREIEDLAAVIAEAGAPAYVFGHSSGAVLALVAAAKGLEIARLALYEPPFVVDDSRPHPPEDFTQRLAELAESGQRDEAVELFLTKGVDLPPSAVAQMRGMPMWPGLAAAAHTLAYNTAIMGDFSVPADRAATIEAPTLVLDGGNSPAWARNSVRAVADAIPGARRLTMEGQDHGAAPEALAPVLRDFFGEPPANI
jgi:pimeloyl-ACP methyl ester carboxylesterase